MKSKKFKFTSHFILSFCIPFHSVLPFLLLTLYPFHFPAISCPVSSYFIQSISIHCNSSHFALLVLIPSNHTRQFHTTHPEKIFINFKELDIPATCWTSCACLYRHTITCICPSLISIQLVRQVLKQQNSKTTT